MKKTFIISSLILTSLILVLSSCIHNEFEEPPVNTVPVGAVFTIQDLYNIHNSDSVALTNYKFTEDFSVYAVVTMDDKSGNIYKSAYIQDGTKAINLHLLSSGGLYEGDSIRIFLKGLVLGDYRGTMQLDSVHVDDNIVKVSTLKHKVPETVTLAEINTDQYLAKLVKLENVQFIDEELGKTYANKEDLITENRTLEDEFGGTILVRTSGYAGFAGNKIPEGRGSIIAILSKYNDDYQLYIRSLGEVNFNRNRFGVYDTVFHTNFEGIENLTPVSLENWENYQETGTISWIGLSGGSNATVNINGNGLANKTWLILPQLELNGAKIEFRTRAGNNTGASLKVYVSNDYDGEGNAEDATWTELPAIIGTAPASGFGAWTQSGTVDLSGHNGQAYITFIYETDSGQNGQYYLDDIIIYKE
ncbi:MAG: DUF5689 domain-containing protein [Bacteroidales bacterium]|nr:DUF5689 domain-containing protein [Bacteroidales bacterium]